MNAKELYQRMEIDFKLGECCDDWSNIDFDPEFVTENFRTRYEEILADNTEEIKKYVKVCQIWEILSIMIFLTVHQLDYSGKIPIIISRVH